MITAPAFVALFGGVALLCRWRGDAAGARTGWVMTAGCVAAWVIVAVSPWWPLWLAVLWTGVAGLVLTSRPQGPANAWVAILGELSAVTYLANYLSAYPFGAITAVANVFGIAAALAIGGPHVGAIVNRGRRRLADLGLGAGGAGVARRGVGGGAGDPSRGP